MLTLVRQLPRISGGLTAALIMLIAVQVAASVLLPLAAGQLVAALTGGGPSAMPGVLLGLTLFSCVLLSDVVFDPIRAMTSARLGTAVDGAMTQRTVEGAMRPAGVAHLDDSAVADQIERARAIGLGGYPPGQAVIALAGLVPLRLGAVGSGVVLAVAGHWWMSVVLGAAWAITGHWQQREVERSVSAHGAQTAELRRAAYLRDLAVTAPAAKEVRLFGMHSWILERFTAAWWDGMVQLRRATTNWRLHSIAILLVLIAHAAVLLPLGFAAAHGDLPADQLAEALQAMLGLWAFGYTGDLVWMLHISSASVPAAVAVSGLGVAATGGSRDAEGSPRAEIRFERVRFAYPGDRPAVLDGLDLVIPAGSSLAIVGDNGAGKSTITKLLAGLYTPDSGQVLVDGYPLGDYEPASWRRQLAMVFQDFVHYPFSIRDNIGFGRVEAPPTDERVAEAARLGGFLGVEADLADGWDARLSAEYTDGTELSGGQWQRLALSRALFAVRQGAQVLVLDEPTAHLDVQAEHDLYARFLEITAGITTILVSHRFATVRLADRIAVVRSGRISEYGTHEELLAAGGRYARMFRIQSEPFAAKGGTRRAH
ncbi:ATP-binding cassette subfamily B protein [Kutzneria buriramensis]|uniref:ATP-binding cassette subfamily B protein n=1 Tax=Kutzneria buriramensis TaxID=1045776 RepID=A0A3E0HIF7_9PSEU|nr:ATP-binding cassette subfamily B protein [Kutzneria buriramensis]